MSKRIVRIGWLLTALAGCGGESESGAGNSAANSCEVADSGAAGCARAIRLSQKGPFLAHESRGARPGDVLIANAFARFYVTGTRGADGYVPYAGWVIDADMARPNGEPDYDGLDGYYPLVNIAPIAADAVTIVHDGADGHDAEVRVEGRCVAVPVVLGLQGVVPHPVPVDVTLTYSLGREDRALRIHTRVVNSSGAAQAVDIGDFVHFGDDEAEPYSVPGGFDVSSDAKRVEAFGSSHEWRPVSYAVFAEEGQLGFFADSSVADNIGGGDSGLWGVTLAHAMLQPGQALEATRYLAVARDISRALSARPGSSDAIGQIAGRTSSGDRDVAGARISVFADSQLHDFLGQAISDSEGGFDIAVQPGRYYVVASGRSNGEYVEVQGRTRELAEGFVPSDPERVAVAAGEHAALDLRLGQAARAKLVVRDAAGEPTAAKVTFVAEDDRPDVLISAGERVPYPALAVRQVAWLASGSAELNIEAGRYTVTASHGFAADLDVQRHVELNAGRTTQLTMTVPEVVPHPGYVAIDSHVHGFYSQHGEATVQERVVTAAAEGLRVHIATDHDWIADYSPAVASEGLEGRLLSVSGSELTTLDGHHCMWPLTRKPREPRGGAPQWWSGGSLPDWYQRYRELGAIVMQVAHGTSYFENAHYDPTTGTVDDGAPFTWDFNAMEVHNGKGDGGRDTLVPIWISLINWGHRVAPLAASDSHWRVPEVGSARTYVRLDAASDIGAGPIAHAVSDLRTVASTGPFIDLRSASGDQPGDTVSLDPSGQVTLRITVWAPGWIPVSDVELLADGRPIAHWDDGTTPAVGLDPARAVWFEHEVTLKPRADTWYAVQVTSDTDLAPVYPDVQPWALTAPLFVQVSSAN